MNHEMENYYEDLMFDTDYLDWKREQELRAWCEWVSMKEAEEQAYDLMAQKYFDELSLMNAILPSEIDAPEEEIEAEPVDFF
jgi:hypothetical protein